MSSNNDVHTAIGEASNDCFSLALGLEPRQRSHHHGKGGIALLEGFHMLLDQQGCGRNQGHLLAILNGFERSPNSHLRFTKPHVPGNETIHRNRPLHIGFHLINGGELIRSFDKRERFFQLTLPGSVGRKSKTRCRHPRGIELH